MLRPVGANRFAHSVGAASRVLRPGPWEAAMVQSPAKRIGRRVRMLASVAAFALLATACVGGGSSGGSDTQAGQKVQPVTPKEPTSPVTVTFQSWVSDASQMKKLSADFHKAHPNITVKFLSVPADNATQKLTTQVAGGNAPDTA